jgi:ABC-type multidrug transport system ATPase subunit
MIIELNQVSKRFNYDWIFSQLNYSFKSGSVYAVTGHNGSGKSTLLRMIAGHLSPSEGTISYTDSQPISREEIFRQVSVTAPYIDLLDEFTMEETIQFQARLKPFRRQISVSEVMELSGLHAHRGKALRYFSSGMKQRVKNILAVLAESKILIMDEPTSNLDEAGVTWYNELLKEHRDNRLVVIGSNQPREYIHADAVLDLNQFKQRIRQ